MQTKIKTHYKHSKVDTFLFNLCTKVTYFLVRHRWLCATLYTARYLIIIIINLIILAILNTAKIEAQPEILTAPEILATYNLEITFQNDKDNPNIHIKNSCLVKDDSEKLIIIKAIMEDPRYFIAKRTRTEHSYIKEWKAHNCLYNWGFQKVRTADVDLDENGYSCLYAILALFE